MADVAARRLVALLGYLKPGATIEIADLAARTGVSAASLASDLMTLAMCGVPPFYPGDCMPLIVEDGKVHVFGELPALSGAVRLSPGEAAALATALQAAGFPAGDDLTSRLLEASAARAFDAAALEHSIRTLHAEHASDVYRVLATALAEHTVVTVDHLRSGTDEITSRDIEPASIFAERGAWYVSAWCRSAGGWRTFRLDRIRSAKATGERAPGPSARPQAPATVAGPHAFAADGLPIATLRFAPDEPFDEREWPGGRVASTEADGSLVAEVPYAGNSWVARRVVARLGAVEVVAPTELRSAVAAMAREELARL